MITQPLTVLDHHYQELSIDGKDVIKGLTEKLKSLPPKYFYDDPGSQLFEKICELPEYYPTRTEAWILEQYADEIAEITNCCELIELGSGSSTKTQALLTAYQKISGNCRYLPIDVSGGILKTSVLQLQEKYPDIAIHGLLGTYEQALVHLESNYLQSRMLFFLGSSLGNFNPEECDIFLNQVSRTLQPGDYFLLGIDLQKPPDILEAAYNDSQEVTAAFNLNMLSHLNWRFQGNFDISLFKHQAVYNQVDHQIEMYLHCQKSHWVSLELLDLKVNFEAGESILTEISRKFNLATMEKNLSDKGLKTVKTWTDEKAWFGLILCQVE
ncbi:MULTISPECIES: L-histidine N(alpha)-methyltransferase [Nostocales]|uniref:L-histidine N(alpha)-methyltransferase n=1 Tax=Nostocales TaxID=1161 RepID=UPI00029B6775|nr:MULTISPECIES: L-histidine N(alpha)-methyltransferase [Nostocales]AFW94477.1 methyltransferase-like protein [Anabaena sp. 90]MTJ16032.1 L-histidine N(alpha)-methyltransferase [Dolichospermum sp. UHCC 0299]MTJ22967.1 L-histidine N(alpha)-methyltransferase [Dolichospermum sp. UHCC 0352]MTJ39889.1 L-histidine N(alpha)-methyltransferase [Dolichospermum sp. UHCC 0406]